MIIDIDRYHIRGKTSNTWGSSELMPNSANTKYYLDGTIFEEIITSADRVIHHNRYYPNGKLFYSCGYDGKKAHGKLEKFDYKGNLIEGAVYENGNIYGEIFELGISKYQIKGKKIRLKKYMTPEEKLKMTLKYGGKWLNE